MLPVAILCGGLGTRLGDLTKMTPKCLLDVAGKPFLVHQLELLQRHGADKVVLCCGSGGYKVWHLIGDGAHWGLDINYAYDGLFLRGTGGALYHARYQLGSPFWYLYGDVMLDADFEQIETAFTGDALMLVARNLNGRERSNVQYLMGKVKAYSKQLPTPAMHHLDAGAGIITGGMLAGFGEVFDLSAPLAGLALRGRLDGATVERPHEIGSIEGLQETKGYLEGLKA